MVRGLAAHVQVPRQARAQLVHRFADRAPMLVHMQSELLRRCRNRGHDSNPFFGSGNLAAGRRRTRRPGAAARTCGVLGKSESRAKTSGPTPATPALVRRARALAASTRPPFGRKTPRAYAAGLARLRPCQLLMPPLGRAARPLAPGDSGVRR